MVNFGIAPDSQLVTGRLMFFLNGSGQAVPVSPTVPMPVTLEAASDPPATGTQTSVASANADTTILAANTARLGATVFNDSTAILYLLLGTGTSSTSVYTVQLASKAYYEVPFSFAGGLKGYWASANGFARVTEFTT